MRNGRVGLEDSVVRKLNLFSAQRIILVSVGCGKIRYNQNSLPMSQKMKLRG